MIPPCMTMKLLRLFLALMLISNMKLMELKATINSGNETDQVSLLALKQGISNDPLGILSSWNDSSHFCKWRGVTCDQYHQRVRALELQGSNLVGLISPSIGNLSFLRSINLGDNKFHGRIPHELGNLFRLRNLNLAKNSLEGGIPSNLSQCLSLRELVLSRNNLVGTFPLELVELSRLVDLSLDLNRLSGGIPHSLGNLSSLQRMNIAHNSFDGSIPYTIALLTSLEFLTISGNRFSGVLPSVLYNISALIHLSVTSNQLHGNIPPDIGLTLPNLRYIAIGGNQFSGTIPKSLSNSTGLQVLDMGNNNFVGQIPSSLGSLQSLQWLGLDTNRLGGGKANDLNFITSLTNCKNLEGLGLNDNLLGGVLPNSITNLTTRLNTLVLGRNRIHGKIPTNIDNLINLIELGMEENFFIGGIPSSLGKLQKLEQLHLYGNRLIGEIPYSLGNITQLSILDLGTNYLEGVIPSTLGQFNYLQILDLSENNLSGTIPNQVIGLSSLSIFLDVSKNSLVGPIPLDVGNLKNLGHFDASKNKLTGRIPITLGSCVSLEFLHLEDNFFAGEIPMSLSSLKGISDLDLSRNNLTGRIPKFLESFPLVSLNLSFNDLEGEVPEGGAFKNASAISLVGNVKLCGGTLDLHLPGCTTKQSVKRGRPFHLKLLVAIITSVAGCLFMSVVLISRWRRWAKKKQPTTPSMRQLIKLSYKDLFDATSGFSSGNLIGSGSFGHVYKGILNQGETFVAVKVLNLRQKGASKSFKAECKALQNIRHRNLVKIVTSCSSIDPQRNDFKALVFEFMPNGNLEQWLHLSLGEHSQSRKLSLTQRINILVDVASALDYLHHQCHKVIIHCDLKPSNILLDEDMTAHVGDFGLARIFLQSTRQNISSTQSSSLALKGSIGYSAPEYGLGGEASTKGDVYSFGIVLLEMMIGRKPTDEMFVDGLNLHIFARTALPERVMQIVDADLLLMMEEEITVEEDTSRRERHDHVRDKMHECIIRLVTIGVRCSMQAPRERMNMREVTRELHLIRNALLAIGTGRTI